MKTIKQVKEENKHIQRLIGAVVNRIGKDSIEDVINHGADSGFNGFIYHSDTHKFAMRNRKLIVEMLEETASQFDEDVVQMVSNFGVFRRD